MVSGVVGILLIDVYCYDDVFLFSWICGLSIVSRRFEISMLMRVSIVMNRRIKLVRNWFCDCKVESRIGLIVGKFIIIEIIIELDIIDGIKLLMLVMNGLIVMCKGYLIRSWFFFRFFVWFVVMYCLCSLLSRLVCKCWIIVVVFDVLMIMVGMIRCVSIDMILLRF